MPKQNLAPRFDLLEKRELLASQVYDVQMMLTQAGDVVPSQLFSLSEQGQPLTPAYHAAFGNPGFMGVANGEAFVAENVSGADANVYNIDWRNGALVVHPASGRTVGIQWVSPKDGVVDLQASLRDVHRYWGDDVAYRLTLTSGPSVTTLAEGVLADGSTADLAAGHGHFSVKAGDRLTLTIDPRQNSDGDYTQVQTVITLSDPPAAAPTPTPTPTPTQDIIDSLAASLVTDGKAHAPFSVGEIVSGTQKPMPTYYRNPLGDQRFLGETDGEAFLGTNVSGTNANLYNINWPSKSVMAHPSATQDVVTVWTASQDGIADLHVDLQDAHRWWGNDVDYVLTLTASAGTTVIAQGTLADGASADLTANASPFPVKAGDKISLRILSRGNSDGDYTIENFTVTTHAESAPEFSDADYAAFAGELLSAADTADLQVNQEDLLATRDQLIASLAAAQAPLPDLANAVASAVSSLTPIENQAATMYMIYLRNPTGYRESTYMHDQLLSIDTLAGSLRGTYKTQLAAYKAQKAIVLGLRSSLQETEAQLAILAESLGGTYASVAPPSPLPYVPTPPAHLWESGQYYNYLEVGLHSETYLNLTLRLTSGTVNGGNISTLTDIDPTKYNIIGIDQLSGNVRINGVYYVNELGVFPLPPDCYTLVGSRQVEIKPGSPTHIITNIVGSGNFGVILTPKIGATESDVLPPSALTLDMQILKTYGWQNQPEGFASGIAEYNDVHDAPLDRGGWVSVLSQVRNIGQSGGTVTVRAYVGYSGDPTQDALQGTFTAGFGASETKSLSFKAGAPGAPYTGARPIITLVATLPDGKQVAYSQLSSETRSSTTESTPLDPRNERRIQAHIAETLAHSTDYRIVAYRQTVEQAHQQQAIASMARSSDQRAAGSSSSTDAPPEQWTGKETSREERLARKIQVAIMNSDNPIAKKAKSLLNTATLEIAILSQLSGRSTKPSASVLEGLKTAISKEMDFAEPRLRKAKAFIAAYYDVIRQDYLHYLRPEKIDGVMNYLQTHPEELVEEDPTAFNPIVTVALNTDSLTAQVTGSRLTAANTMLTDHGAGLHIQGLPPIDPFMSMKVDSMKTFGVRRPEVPATFKVTVVNATKLKDPSELARIFSHVPASAITTDALKKNRVLTEYLRSLGIDVAKDEVLTATDNAIVRSLLDFSLAVAAKNSYSVSFQQAGASLANSVKGYKFNPTDLLQTAIEQISLDVLFPNHPVFLNTQENAAWTAAIATMIMKYQVELEIDLAFQEAGAILFAFQFSAAAIDYMVTDPRLFIPYIAVFNGHAALVPYPVATVLQDAINTRNADALSKMWKSTNDFLKRLADNGRLTDQQYEEQRHKVSDLFVYIQGMTNMYFGPSNAQLLPYLSKI